MAEVALALREPERTVARRGGDLLASGTVAVVGVQARRFPVVVGVRTAPGKRGGRVTDPADDRG